MKRVVFFISCLIVVASFLLSCRHLNHHDINIRISESGHYYKMLACYNRNETRRVEEYMDNRIGRGSNMSFINSRIDGTLGFDDHTTFYIKKYPGYLEIKFDKNKNSSESYYRVKAMCEGIKKVVSN